MNVSRKRSGTGSGTGSITVNDLVEGVFKGRLPDSYSIAVAGDFGEAGLRRMNKKDNEQADNEPYGDWGAEIGPGAFTVTIVDEDRSRPEEGEDAMRQLGEAMTACGRRVDRQWRRGARRAIYLSPVGSDPANEAARLARWRDGSTVAMRMASRGRGPRKLAPRA